MKTLLADILFSTEHPAISSALAVEMPTRKFTCELWACVVVSAPGLKEVPHIDT